MAGFLTRRSVILGGAALLAGCADSGPPVALRPAPAGKGQIYLIRPSTIVGAGNTQLIGINGLLVAELQVGQYTIVPVDPGPVVVSFRERAPFLPVLIVRVLQEIGGFSEVGRTTVAAGQTRAMHFPRFDWLPPAEASVVLGGMKYVPPVTGG